MGICVCKTYGHMTYGPPNGVPGRVFIDSNRTNSETCHELICLAFLQSLERRYDDSNIFFGRVVKQSTESDRQGFTASSSRRNQAIPASLVSKNRAKLHFSRYYSSLSDSPADQRASKTYCTVRWSQSSNVILW